jgi:hypothetical protein
MINPFLTAIRTNRRIPGNPTSTSRDIDVMVSEMLWGPLFWNRTCLARDARATPRCLAGQVESITRDVPTLPVYFQTVAGNDSQQR